MNLQPQTPTQKIKLRRRTYRIAEDDFLGADIVPDVIEDIPDNLEALGINLPPHCRVEEDSQACDAFWCQLGIDNISSRGVNA